MTCHWVSFHTTQHLGTKGFLINIVSNQQCSLASACERLSHHDANWTGFQSSIHIMFLCEAGPSQVVSQCDFCMFAVYFVPSARFFARHDLFLDALWCGQLECRVHFARRIKKQRKRNKRTRTRRENREGQTFQQISSFCGIPNKSCAAVPQTKKQLRIHKV